MTVYMLFPLTLPPTSSYHLPKLLSYDSDSDCSIPESCNEHGYDSNLHPATVLLLPVHGDLLSLPHSSDLFISVLEWCQNQHLRFVVPGAHRHCHRYNGPDL